ncbi:MAG: rod shape-determining protein MreC [Methyloligellaceae bacterium]
MPKGRSNAASYGQRRRRKGGYFLFALYFLSVVLLVLSRLENETVREVRGLFSDLASPVLEAASLPAVYARGHWQRMSSYVELFGELDALKKENERLRQWEWRARRLERRLSHLRSLLNAVDEPALGFTTGRVIADARGPFVRSVLVNVGLGQNVKRGYAVINGDGLVGRTVNVGDQASRIILLSDLNSRIPVLVGPAGVRAVLVGDNSALPRLEFLPDNETIYEGDEVYTSGHGGLLPRGLRVGKVVPGGGKGFRARPHASLNELEYVSVLFFDSPMIVATEGAGTKRANRQVEASGPPRSRTR